MEEEKKQIGEKGSPLLVPISIMVAGALIAGAVLYSNSTVRQPAQNNGNNNLAAVKNAFVPENLADDDPALGSPDAPVTMVEFADFQCPFCGRFFATAEKDIIEKYVKTGKVRFVYRDFPLNSIHDMAQKSAEAGECADEQGRFWPYHDILYQRQTALSLENLKRWAGEVGLDQARFNNCLDSGKYAGEVEKDAKDGNSVGVTGTPATFINGELVTGAVPYVQFEAVIERALKKAEAR